MRLLRFGPKGAEKPGLLDAEGRIRDLSDQITDITPEVLAPDRLRRLAQPRFLAAATRRRQPAARLSAGLRAQSGVHRP